MGTINTKFRIMTLLQDRKKGDMIREEYTKDFNCIGNIPFLTVCCRYSILDYLSFASSGSIFHPSPPASLLWENDLYGLL